MWRKVRAPWAWPMRTDSADRRPKMVAWKITATAVVNPTAASGTGPSGASMMESVTPMRVEADKLMTIGSVRPKMPGTSFQIARIVLALAT